MGKADGQVTVKMTAETAQAFAAFQQMEEKQQRLGKSAQSTGMHFTKLGKEIAGALAANFTVSAIVGGLKELDDWYIQLGKTVTETADKMRALNAVQRPGMEVPVQKLVSMVAAQYGMKGTDVANAAQSMQSLLGGDASKGIEALQAVLPLTKLDVGTDINKAIPVVTMGAAKGLTPQQSVSMAAKGAALSVLGTGEYTRHLGYVQAGFENPVEAAAVTAAIPGSVPMESVGEYGRAAGKELFSTVSKFGKYMIAESKTRGLGDWATMNLDAKIKAMMQIVPNATDPQAIRSLVDRKGKSAGIKQIEAAQAIAGIMQNRERIPGFEKELSAVKDSGVNYAETRYREQLANDAALRLNEETEKAKRAAEIDQTYSPRGLKAAERNRDLIQRGSEMKKQGVGMFLDKEGMPGWYGIGRIMEHLFSADASVSMGTGAPGRISNRPSGDELRDKTAQELNESIKRQTEAVNKLERKLTAAPQQTPGIAPRPRQGNKIIADGGQY